jgi:hypothetical protein
MTTKPAGTSAASIAAAARRAAAATGNKTAASSASKSSGNSSLAKAQAAASVVATKKATTTVATIVKDPKLFPTAPGGAMAGKTIGAAGNAMNQRVLDAYRASGGTTTSTYRDKYDDAGLSALQSAQQAQERGAAAIFQRVADKAGSTLAASYSGSTGKLLAGSGAATLAQQRAANAPRAPPVAAPAKAVAYDPGNLSGIMRAAEAAKASQPQIRVQAPPSARPVPVQVAQPSYAGVVTGLLGSLAKQLAPGVQARISAKGGR